MSKPDRRDIDRRLRAGEAPEPPPELLARLKAEIPEDLVAANSGEIPLSDVPRRGESEGDRGGEGRRQLWLAAASVAVLVSAGWLALEHGREGRIATPAPARQAAEAVSEPAARMAPEEPAAVIDGAERAEEVEEAGDADRGEQARPADEAAAAGRDAEALGGARPVVGVEGEDRRQVAPPARLARPRPEPRSKSAGQPPAAFRDDAAREQLRRPSRRERAELERALRSELKALNEEVAPRRERPRPSPDEPSPAPSTAFTGSTGGTAEPNDRPYGDVFFEHSGVHPFVDTEDDPLSTFGMDVDTGSYTVARRYLEDGHLPPPAAIRVEEFLNYFDYGDAPPEPGRGDFALRAEGAASPFAEGPRYHLLRFALKAREVASWNRPPALLVFVVDVSGSMGRGDRLGLVRRALDLLLAELRPDDRVGLVVYGSRGRVLLEPTGDREAVRAAIAGLTPGGSTNAEEGLVLGYEMAARHLRDGAIHRLVLCSDGVANVGATGPESILARVEREARRGIELTTVGFGMGNYNDVLMEQLADRGDGAYAYVDDLEEARRVFVENLTGTLQTVAADAKVQVEFSPRAVERYRLLGYENRDVADERFRDDTVDAGEIGAGHGVTALYEVKLAAGAERRDLAATLRLRYRSKASGEVVEQALPVRVGELVDPWSEASPALRLASLVAEFAEILKGSYWAREGDPEEVARRLRELAPRFPGQPEVAELATLAGRAAELRRRAGAGE